MLEMKTVALDFPADANIIVGQAHFIKTVEDLYEAVVQTVPGVKFGVAFCEASGPCLIRHTGTETELESAAIAAANAIGAGHVFVMMLSNAFPVNVLNQIKTVTEVCNVFCASANPLTVVIAEHNGGRGIMGVIDGSAPKGIEEEKDRAARHTMIRRFGYKQ
jgi:uncharacterized protein